MDINEVNKVGVAASRISSIFYRESGFVTSSVIREQLKRIGGRQEDTDEALDVMVKRGQLDVDNRYGYCPHGEKSRLIQRAEYLKTHEHISRSAFNQLNLQEKTDFVNRGGVIA
jgi:hypothetical protein